MSNYTKSQLEAINKVELLLLKKEEKERMQEELIRKVEHLLHRRISVNT